MQHQNSAIAISEDPNSALVIEIRVHNNNSHQQAIGQRSLDHAGRHLIDDFDAALDTKLRKYRS